MAEETSVQHPGASEPDKPVISESAIFSALSDLCFVLLPFIVIALVLAFTGRIHELLSIPEWSIATPVIVGQTVARIVGTAMNRPVAKEPILFILCAIIVLLLVPSLIVLGFILTVAHMTTALVATQIGLFVIGIFVSFTMNCMLFDVEHTPFAKKA